MTLFFFGMKTSYEVVGLYRFALSDTMGERLAKLFEEKSGFIFDCLFHFFLRTTEST